MSRFINPYTDFGFKKLFGQEGSKDLLMDFLNEILPGEHRIDNLTFSAPEDLPDALGARKAVFDIFCRTRNGERFIVEMQKAEQKYFKDRTVFYSTFPIRSQAIKGLWNFKLAPVYCVGILDFLFDDEPGENGETARQRGRGERHDDMLTTVQLKDQFCRVFYENLTYAFIEMPRFKLREAELTTHLHKWLYFLKNLDSLESIPEILREPVFEKGFHLAELAGMTAEERDAYEESLKHYRDIVNVIETAEEKGYHRGLEVRAEELNAARQAVEYERRQKEAALAATEAERLRKEDALARWERARRIMLEAGLNPDEP